MEFSRPFGITGLDVSPGEHICAFFTDLEQRDAVLVPFIQQGVTEGAMCLCLLDGRSPDALLSQLPPGVGGDQVVCRPAEEAYEAAVTDPYGTLKQLHLEVDEAIAAGFPFVRIGGEIPPNALAQPEGLLTYERGVSTHLPTTGQVALCLYDLEQLSGAMIMALLSAHPQVLIGGRIVVNPYYDNARERRVRQASGSSGGSGVIRQGSGPGLEQRGQGSPMRHGELVEADAEVALDV